MDNILFCSVGRRGKLLQDFRKSMNGCGKIIGTELSPVAPALFFCDEKYLVPRIDSPDYYNHIFDICEKCDVKAITTLIDPEIELLAKRRDAFLNKGVLPLCPADWTAHLCFDKYEMFKYLHSKGVRTVLTYNSLEGLKEGLERGEISFPVFMKPISGSGSVGIGKVNNWEEAEANTGGIMPLQTEFGIAALTRGFIARRAVGTAKPTGKSRFPGLWIICGCGNHRDLRRYSAVMVLLPAAISAGVPVKTISPPEVPPSGPTSMR